MALPGYEVGPELYHTERHAVRRGRRVADGQRVLVKGPRDPSRPADLESLRREFALLRELDLAGVPKAFELVRSEGGLWLVLEDAAGLPMASPPPGPMDLDAFFDLTLALTSIVGALHRANVIHKNIHPGSILVDPASRQVWLAEFGLASRASGETHLPVPPALLAGALEYMSPEQTGRMNRGIDSRTDLYSLGVTFYELLTGTRPFSAADRLELIHAHIARSPVPPAELQSDLPEPLSRITLKLLEKTADARYQSAFGLRADLEVCARQWRERRGVTPFPLGRQDASDRFLIPQRLYGRDAEVAALAAAFDRASAGPAALMLVGGYSGIGKTSLIQELYKPIVGHRGYFTAGKFDQVARNVPHGALIQGFRGLIHQLLAESDDRLARWRTRLADALEANGGVVAEVIPEIELILGRQPPAAPLEAAETQNRFRLVFQRFVGALAGAEHPLVVFLDDLQWADAASLALLQPLLTSPDIRFRLLIGAYGDNEVDVGHPLTRTVSTLESAGARVDRIILGPLGLAELTLLTTDCLRRSDAATEDLARLVAAKTEGNPFFVVQFLKGLRHEGLLAFDPAERRWTFRTDEIARAPMTQNVIDLMSRKIQRLSSETQELLTLAACVGSSFDLPTLSTVSRRSPPEAAASLGEAIGEGLVVPRTSGAHGGAADGEDAAPTYDFLHDRVQQAAYARPPEESRKALHLAVGRLLRDRWGGEVADARGFDVVNHLNMGRGLIGDEAERLSLVRLNLSAGQRAKSSTAYQAALGYFRTGLELLPRAGWSSDYPLTFELHREAAECEYLCGQFAEAERRFEELLERARTALDKAQVYDLRLIQNENLSRYAEAARIGREAVSLFGVSLPDDEAEKRAALEAEIQAIERLHAGRGIESLVDLPVMDDAERRILLRLLTDMWAPAYISGDGVLTSLVSARMVRLSIEHGNTEDSAYGYVTHAITIGPLRGDYRAAYEWGALALRVNERFGDQRRRAKIHQQFNAHVSLWRRPIATCIPHAQEACRSGLQTGDFTYAGYGAFTEGWPAFLISNDLDRFLRDYTPTLDLLQRIRTEGLAATHRVLLGWARALQGRTRDRLSLSDGSFDEQAFVSAYGHNPFFMTIFHVAKLRLAVLFQDQVAALDAARPARLLGPWGRGTIWPVLLDFWGGLAAAAAPSEAAGESRRSLREELVASRDALEPLAESCPENFRCFWLLLNAELERVDGRFESAFERCEAAIRYARESDNLQNEALASEVCGRLWLGRADGTVARAYLGAARRCYEEWGAMAKVHQLEERHPGLRPGRGEGPAPSLDVASVTKAAHAVAREIVLDDLLRKLMEVALESAGAERGVFLEERDDRLVVVAEGSVQANTVRLLEPAPIESATGLARGVVHYVQKTLASFVLGDAAGDERFAADPYILATRAKSILCVPVVHQGKLGGILYLENTLTGDAFTADRLRVLDVISAQAAIALENARLYREKTEEVDRRRRAEDDLRAALAEVESLKNRLEAENVYFQEEIRDTHNFDEMVGSSPALMEVLRRVELAAPTDSSVLISGETGTGKELIARAIHNRSRRKDRPLVKVNCGAIAAGLVESEMFGHVQGAFTGALDKRVGRFELAHGGTIFLDEIGELPLDTQVKLLRVLQEQEFEPVGSSRTARVDVRVIAATNRDLKEAIRAGRFRPDLFYRLNVLPLRMPPLRERRSDVPHLVAFFLERFARGFGKDVKAVSQDTMERLVDYAWPGNIRELQNVIERAVVLAAGPVLMLDRDLLPVVSGSAAMAASREPGAAGADAPPAAGGAALDAIDRQHILTVLQSCAGVIEGSRGAARILGLHPNTLRSRMKKLGIRRPPAR